MPSVSEGPGLGGEAINSASQGGTGWREEEPLLLQDGVLKTQQSINNSGDTHIRVDDRKGPATNGEGSERQDRLGETGVRSGQKSRFESRVGSVT